MQTSAWCLFCFKGYCFVRSWWFWSSYVFGLICPTASHSKLAEMVGELSTALTGAKHEQEYMEVRERIHRASECPECSVFPALASVCVCVVRLLLLVCVCSLPLLVCVHVCVLTALASVCVVRECIHRTIECPHCSVLTAIASVCVVRECIHRTSECLRLQCAHCPC